MVSIPGAVQGLRVQSTGTGQQAARLKELRLSLAWWPLLSGRIAINSLVLVEPSLALERQATGGADQRSERRRNARATRISRSCCSRKRK